LPTVVVAGATSTLGLALCLHLSSQGFSLVLIGKNEAKLLQLRDELPKPATIHVIDVDTQLADVAALVEGVMNSDPNVSGLISMLGHIKPTPMSGASLDLWMKSMRINFQANVELIRGFSRQLSPTKQVKSVVMMSSVAASRGDLGLAPYAASKAALESLVRSASVELASKQIRVNAISLGLLDVGMGQSIERMIGNYAFKGLEQRYPLGLGGVDSFLGAIDFLIGEGGRWTTGSVLQVDGGYSAT
jgi:3-oxoacyl-[acyl-carrier protein] reductase